MLKNNITDTQILDWLIENAIEFKPSGYDGCNFDRFDMMLPTKVSDIRELVIKSLKNN